MDSTSLNGYLWQENSSRQQLNTNPYNTSNAQSLWRNKSYSLRNMATWGSCSLPQTKCQIFPEGRANLIVCGFTPDDCLPSFHVISLITVSPIGTGVFKAIQDSLRQLLIYLADSNLSYCCDLSNMNISLWNLFLLNCLYYSKITVLYFIFIFKPYIFLCSSTTSFLPYKYYSFSNFLPSLLNILSFAYVFLPHFSLWIFSN